MPAEAEHPSDSSDGQSRGPPAGIKALLCEEPGRRDLVVELPELVSSSTQGIGMLLKLLDIAIDAGEAVLVLSARSVPNSTSRAPSWKQTHE